MQKSSIWQTLTMTYVIDHDSYAEMMYMDIPRVGNWWFPTSNEFMSGWCVPTIYDHSHIAAPGLTHHPVELMVIERVCGANHEKPHEICVKSDNRRGMDQSDVPSE